MFKKAFNALYCALPDILLIVLFSMWVHKFSHFIREYGCSIKELEYGLYAMLALLFYRLYTNVNKCVKASRKFRIIFAVVTASCYSVALWFLHSWLLYLEINSRLPFIRMSYKDMLWSNSFGEWPYPLAALLMLTICLMLPWVKEKIKPLGEYILNKFLDLFSEEETTSTKVKDYLYHKNALQVWCVETPKTVEFKNELIQYAFEADEMLLYGLLLAHFSDQMAEDEYNSVIEKYARFLIIQTSQQTGENEDSKNS